MGRAIVLAASCRFGLQAFTRDVLSHYLLGRAVWACIALALLNRPRP